MLTTWPFDPPPLGRSCGGIYTKKHSFDWSYCLSTNVFLFIRAYMRSPFFSVNLHSANLQFHLLLFNYPLRFNSSPTFLGVTFDDSLSFPKHVSSLKTKFFPRLKAEDLTLYLIFLMGCLSFLNKAFLRPLVTYVLPEWLSFLSVTNVIKLECLHRAVSRAISGCHSSFPCSSL